MVNLIVKKVIRHNDSNEIISIELNNGYVLVASEDTGGEFATLEINGKKNILKRGSVINFNNPIVEGEIWGVKTVNINDVIYPARVVSDGGNSSTFLEYKKIEKKPKS